MWDKIWYLWGGAGSGHCLVQSENISTPIYVECYKMYQSKFCVQKFLYFMSGLDIQLEQSENNSPVGKNQLQVAKYDK